MKLHNLYFKKMFMFCILVTILTTLFMNPKYMEIFGKFICVKEIKYILLWTDSRYDSLVYMIEGREGFVSNKCPHTNCYVTTNKSFLGDYSRFDVVAFYGLDLYLYNYQLPEKRSPHQKYLFASTEPSQNYSLCSEKYNNYFNWTWTHKFDSDIRSGFVIRDTNKTIVGPKKDMHWLNITEMKSVSEEFKAGLTTKKYIATWIISDNELKSKGIFLVNELQYELLKLNHSYLIDIYGGCDKYYFPEGECSEVIKNSYYFYLALENSFNEDSVTENVLMGLQNNAVPVVFGKANYTMYMPDGIYLDATKLEAKQLAHKMHELVVNRTKYEEYFKWKNHYSYHKTQESVETNEHCLFCKILNDKELVKKKTVVENFVAWWNSEEICLNKNSNIVS